MSLAAWVNTIADLLKNLGWQIVLLTLILVLRRQLRTLIEAIRDRLVIGGWRAGLGSGKIEVDQITPFPPVNEKEGDDV